MIYDRILYVYIYIYIHIYIYIYIYIYIVWVLIIRIGFRGRIYTTTAIRNPPKNSSGSYFGPYIRLWD